MRQEDLPSVVGLADASHPSLPEEPAVFENRLRLYADGCLVLGVPGAKGAIAGYAIGHPWRGDVPPKLDTVLDALPHGADRFYIHDVVVSPPGRGRGQASAVVERLLAQAAAFPAAMLVSVYGTPPFWSRFGFVDASDTLPERALRPYGDGARFMIRWQTN